MSAQTNDKPEIATQEKVEKIDKMAEIQNEKDPENLENPQGNVRFT